MYNKGDLSYLTKPKFMSKQIIDATLNLVKEYCAQNNLTSFSFVFHGGEPLLAPQELFAYFIDRSKLILKDINISFYLQTNGVLVDQKWCDFFDMNDIRVGFSLDGDELTNDKNRVFHSGEGSYQKVLEGIKVFLKKFNRVGVISVIDLESNPVESYESLVENGITKWNLLLPDFTHENLPFDKINNIGSIKLGEWLLTLFEHWNSLPIDNRLHIDLFVNISNLILGRTKAGNDHLGTVENNTLVIETNGSIESTDPLRTCEPNITNEGINVFNNFLSDAFNTKLVKLYFESHLNLPSICQNCDLRKICGGGYIVHRYSKENNFNNPSIYCNDLKAIIYRIQKEIKDKLYLDAS